MPTVDEIVTFLDARDSYRELSAGALAIEISRPVPLVQATAGHVSFCGATARDPMAQLSGTSASLVIVERSVRIDEVALRSSGVKAVVLSANARLDFIRVVEKFFAPARPHGTSPSASVSSGARIGKDVYVGPLSSIGDRVEVGDGTIIHAGVHVYHGMKIGRNVVLHSGVLLGGDGFGFERQADGVLRKFPQIGGVKIEDSVEIGANSCVDHGALSDTVVGEGTKMDNMVHVAHNVRVGRHAVVIAEVMIGGGTEIGDYARIAPSACLRNNIRIGAHSTVGLASLVTKDVPDRATILDSPARQQSDHRLLMTHLSDVIEAKRPKDR